LGSNSKFDEIISQLKSGKSSDALIKALLNTGVERFTRIDRNLYFRITPANTGFWVYQYKISLKVKSMTLGTSISGVPLKEYKRQ
jgi:hypothetical protein